MPLYNDVFIFSFAELEPGIWQLLMIRFTLPHIQVWDDIPSLLTFLIVNTITERSWGQFHSGLVQLYAEKILSRHPTKHVREEGSFL